MANTMSPWMIDLMLDHYNDRLHEARKVDEVIFIIGQILLYTAMKANRSFSFKTS